MGINGGDRAVILAHYNKNYINDTVASDSIVLVNEFRLMTIKDYLKLLQP